MEILSVPDLVPCFKYSNVNILHIRVKPSLIRFAASDSTSDMSVSQVVSF